MNSDLSVSRSKQLPISLYKFKGFISKTENNLKLEQKLQGEIHSATVNSVDRSVSYNLTGLSGEKLFTPEEIRLRYNIEIEKSRKVIFNNVTTQNVTFMNGSNIVADYSDVYNHSYRFKKNLSKKFALTNIKSYNLITSGRSFGLNCNLNSCCANFSIVEYNLKG